MYVEDIYKDFTVDDMKNWIKYNCVRNFSVDYNTVNISNIADIHKYLLRKHN